MRGSQTKRGRTDSTEDPRMMDVELLGKILTEVQGINTLNTTMSKILTILTKIKDEMDIVNKTGQENSKKIEEMLSKTADILVDELGKMSVTQAKVLTSIVKTLEGNHIKEKIPNWNILLNARKMDYWNHLRNVKIAETYVRWCGSDPPIIPKKFQPAPILGENAGQRRARLNLATDQMKCEIEIMNIKAQSLKQKFEALDSQTGQEIEEKFANQYGQVTLGR